MIELLMIADDMTGTLDSSVKLAEQGISTCVYSAEHLDFDKIDDDVCVAAVNTSSRHMSSQDAYDVVRRVCEAAKAAGVKKVYKKTDSVLRGNIGSELQAVMDVYGGENLYFLPAYPAAGRTTVRGVQYCDGVKLEESVFSKDAFEPVTKSRVSEIIAQQTDVPVIEAGDGPSAMRTPLAEAMWVLPAETAKPSIIVIDAEKDSDISAFAKTLQEKTCSSGAEMKGRNLLLAGCAGFAGQIWRLLPEGNASEAAIPDADRILVVSGSLNAVSKEQIDALRDKGYPCTQISIDDMDDEKLRAEAKAIRDAFIGTDVAVIETAARMEDMAGITEEQLEKNRIRAGEILSDITAEVLKGMSGTDLLVVGGDTIKNISEKMFQDGIEPVGTIDEYGIVSIAKKESGEPIRIISKSGGFGDRNTLYDICKAMVGKKEAHA